MTDTTGQGSNGTPGGTNGGVPAGNGGNTTGQQAQAGSSQAENQGTNTQAVDVSALLSRIDALEKSNTKANAEAAKYRSKLKALASDEPETGNQGQPGSGIDPQTQATLRALRDGRAKDQLALVAEKSGAVDPSNIWRYVELEAVSGEDGTVANPEKLMADLRKQYPYMFKPPVNGSADGGNGRGNPETPGDMNALIRNGFRGLRGQLG